MAQKILKCRKYKFDLSKKKLIMGILNVTPDSFSDGGRFLTLKRAYKRALQMEKEGADIIDIGGESTRPGSLSVSADEEIRRVLPVIKKLKGKLKIPISIDTTKHKVAEAALSEGASIVNDISGLRASYKMALLCAKYKAGLIIMHMKGSSSSMQRKPVYKDILKEIKSFLKHSADIALNSGIKKENIIIDPGIGFGKTLTHNLKILNNLAYFKQIGYPVLVGLSRKSFISKLLKVDLENRLVATVAANALAIHNGADIIRVHDVKEAAVTVKLATAVRSN